MVTTSHNFTPFIPDDTALSRSDLPDLVIAMVGADAKLAGHLTEVTKETIRQYMEVINSYYSNLIEGNHTHPHEIRAAQRGEYHDDPLKRDLQRESVAHIHVQNWVKQQTLDEDSIYSCDFPRQGAYDGRGLLSQGNLVEFCRFMLAAAIDQIEYATRLLDLGQIQKRISRYIQARNDNRVPAISAGIKEAASLVLYQAFIHGELERHMAYELCGMPDRSARRLLAQLKEEGLLTETSSRAPLRWSIPEHAEPWYFPELVPGHA